MPRLQMVDAKQATGTAKELLDGIQKKIGMTPNIYRTMANSPASLDALMQYNAALGKGTLSSKLREQIALAVGEANSCDYCLAAHSTIGRSLGLSDEAVFDSRRGTSSDPKTHAALEFAQAVVEKRGHVSDDDVNRVRAAGYDDGGIVEILAVVVANIFTNYFNHVADTAIDFPRVDALAAA